MVVVARYGPLSSAVGAVACRSSIATVGACYVELEGLGGAALAAIEVGPASQGACEDSLTKELWVVCRLTGSESEGLMIWVRFRAKMV